MRAAPAPYYNQLASHSSGHALSAFREEEAVGGIRAFMNRYGIYPPHREVSTQLKANTKLAQALREQGPSLTKPKYQKKYNVEVKKFQDDLKAIQTNFDHFKEAVGQLAMFAGA